MEVNIWNNYKDILNSFDDKIEITDLGKVKTDEQELIRINNYCKHCKNTNILLDYDEGGYICGDCGRKIEEFFDQNQEWRNHFNDDSRKFGDPSRVGLPINEHFKKASLSTTILGYGNELYRKYHIYNSMEYDERRLLKNFNLISESVEDRNIPESKIEQARKMFKTVSEDDPKRGSRKHSIMGACVLFVSEDKDYKQNKEKISDCFKIKKKKLTKGCNFYKETIFEKEPEYYEKLKPTNTEDEVERFANELEMPEIYKNITKYVAHMASEIGIILKNTPSSIAVGSIYLVTQVYKLNISKKEIIEKCNTSDVTMNKAYKALLAKKSLLIPNKKLFDEYMAMKN